MTPINRQERKLRPQFARFKLRTVPRNCLRPGAGVAAKRGCPYPWK